MQLNSSSSKPRYHLLISAPWGNGNGEFAPQYKSLPNRSLVAPGQMRQVASPLRIKLDAQRGVHVLNLIHKDYPADSQTSIDHFSLGGTWESKTVFQPSPPDWKRKRVIDFAVDPQCNGYVLERVEAAAASGVVRQNVLSKYNAKGALLWRKEGAFETKGADFESLSGEFSGLFAGPSSALFLTANSPSHQVGVIDADTGSYRQTFELPPGLEQKIFVTPSGLIASKLFFQEKGLYAMAALQPGGSLKLQVIAGNEASSFIQFAFAADNALNFYALMPAGVFDRAGIARIPFEGAPVIHCEFKEIVVGPSDQAVHLSSANGERISVASYFRDGTSRQLTLSPAEGGPAGQRSSCVLTAVDAMGRFVFHQNEGPGEVGQIALYSPEGQLESVQVPTPDQMSGETVRAHGMDWVVDGEGAIYVPIADSNGFKIVRIRALEEGAQP